jgi:hypothetical protein
MTEIIEHVVTGIMLVIFLELYYTLNFNPELIIDSEENQDTK